MKRTAADIYATARAAGLSTAQAVIATAIALGESSGDDTAVGDVNLQTGDWGPSVGLWQVRTLKSQTGTGSDRDIQELQGNPARQAQAMFNISSRGTNWSPWTVYTRGTYQQYLGQATAAIAGGSPITGTSPSGPVPTPVGLASDTVSAVIEPAKKILIKLAFSTLGLALVTAGVVLAVRPQIDKGMKVVNDQVDKAVKVGTAIV